MALTVYIQIQCLKNEIYLIFIVGSGLANACHYLFLNSGNGVCIVHFNSITITIKLTDRESILTFSYMKVNIGYGV